MEEEIWKDIPGYEGLYQASTTGLIKNYGRQLLCQGHGKEKPKILSPSRTYQGYLRIRLIDKEGNRKTYGVHQLIAMTYIPNPENKPCVDHINTIRDDNRVENLRWCTILENFYNPLSYNNYRSAMKKRRGIKMPPEFGKKISERMKGYVPSQKTREIWSKQRRERAKPIIQLSLNGEIIREWKSIFYVHEELGIDKSAIYKCIKGKLHQTGGYKWKFKE